MDRWMMGGWTNGWMYGWVVEWMNGLKNGCINGLIGGLCMCVVGWKDGCGWADVCMYG